MMDHVFWVVYWTIVFAGVSWGVHETWPYGLMMIPICVIAVALRREAERRFGVE